MRKKPFMPTIFEHSSSFLGVTPSEAAQNADLMSEGHIEAWNEYGHDLVTVGIDVYNIEAEALGCEIKYHNGLSIPGVISHPFHNDFDNIKNKESFVYNSDRGRTGLVLRAAKDVYNKIGDKVPVSVGICGTFSIAAELVGYEKLIELYLDDPEITNILFDNIFNFQKGYIQEIINGRLGLAVFESWATPPLLSPDVYATLVAPWESKLIDFAVSVGARNCPIIIGGNTCRIANSLIETGTSILVADYCLGDEELKAYIELAESKNIKLRCNIDPKLVSKGSKEDILKQVDGLIAKAGSYGGFILGTGVLPYDTPPDNVRFIRAHIRQ